MNKEVYLLITVHKNYDSDIKVFYNIKDAVNDWVKIGKDSCRKCEIARVTGINFAMSSGISLKYTLLDEKNIWKTAYVIEKNKNKSEEDEEKL